MTEKELLNLIEEHLEETFDSCFYDKNTKNGKDEMEDLINYSQQYHESLEYHANQFLLKIKQHQNLI